MGVFPGKEALSCCLLCRDAERRVGWVPALLEAGWRGSHHPGPRNAVSASPSRPIAAFFFSTGSARLIQLICICRCGSSLHSALHEVAFQREEIRSSDRTLMPSSPAVADENKLADIGLSILSTKRTLGGTGRRFLASLTTSRRVLLSVPLFYSLTPSLTV